MIFVTVGTHEQPFDRLIMKIDELIENRTVGEKIFAQIGYGNYKPRKFEHQRQLSFRQMHSFIKKARIVITHGGPGNIILVLTYGRIPIVVPRQKKYGEHVDDHQVSFTKRLEEKNRIIAVYEIKNLADKIVNYDSIIQNKELQQNYQQILKKKVEDFAKKLDKICQELCKGAV